MLGGGRTPFQTTSLQCGGSSHFTIRCSTAGGVGGAPRYEQLQSLPEELPTELGLEALALGFSSPGVARPQHKQSYIQGHTGGERARPSYIAVTSVGCTDSA